jgi:hypothetical protein
MSMRVLVDGRQSAVVDSESHSICVYIGMWSAPVKLDTSESVGV